MINRKLTVCGLMAAFVFSVALFATSRVVAQTGPATDIVLVLPFENTSNHPEYNWIGESFADSLTPLLNKPGLIVISGDERALIYQRIRLPQTIVPSRATAIKLAREARATMVVLGTYGVTLPPERDEKTKDKPEASLPAAISGEVRVIRVNEGRLAGVVYDGNWMPRAYTFGGAIGNLQTMQGALAYDILYERDKALAFSRSQLIQEATKIPPRAFEAYVKSLMTGESDPRRAVYLKNALHLTAKENPGAVYPQAAFELGRFYVNQGKWKEAAEYLTMLQKKDAHYSEAQFYAGLAYWKLGDFDNALKVLQQLALDMPLVGVYNNAGVVSVQAARGEKRPEERNRLLTQGLALLSRASQSSPDDQMVRFNYSYALFLSGRFADAAEQIQGVTASDSRDGQAYFILAKALEQAGRHEQANAADDQARRHLQAYAKWQVEWQKSQSLAGVSLRIRELLNPDDVIALRQQQAATAEAKAASSTQDLLVKARELYQAGRDDEALPELRKVVMYEPTNAEAFLLSGRIHQRRGDQEAAIAALKTAIFWDPKLIDAHILLGRIFVERGDRGEARKYADSAMNIDPNNQEAIALYRQVTMGRQ